jgi:hypothetical protein
VVLRRAASARLDHLGVTRGSGSGSCSSPQPSTRSYVACSFDRSHLSKVVMAEVGLPPHAMRRMLSALGSSTLDTEAAADATLSSTRSA